METIGRYRVLRTLGQGAMGTVYLAEDPHIERKLAIKMIREDGPGTGTEAGAEIEKRFLREAKLAGQLTHPNIVAVYDVGTQGNVPWIAMEFIEGQSLSDRMRQGPPLSLVEKVSIVRGVARALGHAHAKSVIHRDIKPANVMLTGDGQVKVADFGIGKRLGESTEMTRTGMMVGSPSYMSPEQIRGEKVDSRSDLFSLGVVFFELLTGERPFPADTITTLVYQILTVEPPDPSALRQDLPPAVGGIIRRALAKNPNDRYQTADEMERDLGALAASLTERTEAPTVITSAPAFVPEPGPTLITASPATGSRPFLAPPPVPAPSMPAASMPSTPAPSADERKKKLVVALALGALLVLLLGVGAVLLLRRPPAPAPSGLDIPPPTGAPASGAPLAPVEPPPPTSADVASSALAEPVPVGSEPVDSSASSASPKGLPSSRPLPESRPAAQPVIPPAQQPAPPPVQPSADPGGEPSGFYRAQEQFKINADPEQARLYLDGRYIGVSDDWDGFGGGDYLVPPPGRHRLRFSLPGHRDEVVEIELTGSADDDEQVIEPKLVEIGEARFDKKLRPGAKTRGPVLFDVKPSSTTVTVDGEAVGTVDAYSSTPLNLKGGPRVADILLQAPNGKKKMVRVLVSPKVDEAAKIKEKLE